MQVGLLYVNIYKLGGGKIVLPILLCNDVTRYKPI